MQGCFPRFYIFLPWCIAHLELHFSSVSLTWPVAYRPNQTTSTPKTALIKPLLNLDYERLVPRTRCSAGRAKWVGILWSRGKTTCVLSATQLADREGQCPKWAGAKGGWVLSCLRLAGGTLSPHSQQNERGWREGTEWDSCSAGLAYFESSLEIKSLAWSTVALPNPRAPGYRKTNLSDAELSSSRRSLLSQHACITWVVCVRTHTFTCFFGLWPPSRGR